MLFIMVDDCMPICRYADMPIWELVMVDGGEGRKEAIDKGTKDVTRNKEVHETINEREEKRQEGFDLD